MHEIQYHNKAHMSKEISCQLKHIKTYLWISLLIPLAPGSSLLWLTVLCWHISNIKIKEKVDGGKQTENGGNSMQ